MQSKFQIMRANRERNPGNREWGVIWGDPVTYVFGASQPYKSFAEPKWVKCIGPSVVPSYWDQVGQVGLGCAHEFGEPPAALGAHTPGMKTCRKCGMSRFPGQ